MAVASRNNATVVNSAATPATGITLTKPTGTVSGDLLLTTISTSGGTGASMSAVPSGWTQISTQQNNGTNQASFVYYRVCNGTEGASFTWTLGANQSFAAAMCGYTGVDNANPISNFAVLLNNTSVTSIAFSNYNQHTENDFLVNLVNTRGGTAARTITTASSGFTKRADTSSTTASPFMQAGIEDGATSGTTLQVIAIGATTMSGAVGQQIDWTVGLRATVTSAGFDVDTAFLSTVASASAITSEAFTTGYANEVILVVWEGSASNTPTISNSAGLSFTLIASSDSVGAVPVKAWWALASSPISAKTVTLTGSGGFSDQSIMIYSLLNVDTSTFVGATASNFSSNFLTPSTVSLTTTRNGSWVWGASNNSGTTDTTPGTAQTKQYSFNATTRQTAQRQNATTPSSGTSVTINTTAPNTSYATIAFEILPVAVASGPIGKFISDIQNNGGSNLNQAFARSSYY